MVKGNGVRKWCEKWFLTPFRPTGCTNVQDTYDYNNRMQPVRFQLGTSASPSADYCLVYNYYQGVANPTTCTSTPTTATAGNNGNVAGIYDLDGPNNSLMTHTEAYSYDKVNRLTSAIATGNATYNLSFSYTQDGSSGNYGNMSCLTNGQTHGLCPNYTFSAATNHISTSGFNYDLAGNLTSDGTHSYTWDAEGRLVTMDGGTTANITYNALGQMVQNGGGSTTYNADGERISGSGFNIVPWGDVALVKYGTNTNFVHGNGLQSSTIVTSQTGAVLQDLIFYPWGQSWVEHDGSVDGTFATMEPLAQGSGEETAITPNRDYSQSYGRWLSPDPLGGDVTNPQSLNLYAYALNNPTSIIDPLGLCSSDDSESVDDCCSGQGWVTDPSCQGPGGGGGGGVVSTGSTNPGGPSMPGNAGFPGQFPRQTGGTYPCDFGLCTGSIWNPFTLQVGGSINFTWWIFSINYSAGFAIDLHGHVAAYRAYGGGGGAGAGLSAGVQGAYSNANTVCGLGGPFLNASGTFGAGGAVSADVFHGKGDGPGGTVTGGGVTAGGGAAADSSITITNTDVTPIGSVPCH